MLTIFLLQYTSILCLQLLEFYLVSSRNIININKQLSMKPLRLILPITLFILSGVLAVTL